MTLDVDSILICDDIRREDNGKLILIGVFGRDIGFSDFPAAFAPRLFLRIRTDAPIDTSVEFRCLLNEEQKARIKGTLRLTEPGDALLNTPNLMIDAITEPGSSLLFQWRVGDAEEWETIYSIPIAQR